MDRMETIKNLLKEMKISDELTTQFTSNLDAFIVETKESTQKQLQEEFDQKLAKIKKVCLEETRNYKNKLAKKLQVFLETKANAIESQIAKQVAIRESAAEADLREVKAILEGYKVNAEGNADLRAITDQLNAAQTKVKNLTEERDRAVNQAVRAKQIAQTVIDRAKVLQESKGTPAAAAPAPAAPKAPAPAAATVQKQGDKPQTTNTIAEETVAVKPEAVAAPLTAPENTNTMAMTPEAIAAAME